MSECPGLTLSGVPQGWDRLAPTLADMGIAGAPLYTPRSGAMEREWRVGISAVLLEKDGCPSGGYLVAQPLGCRCPWGVTMMPSARS